MSVAPMQLDMGTEQLPLFQRKSFAAVLTQGAAMPSPTAQSSVLATLPAYFAYLQSQGYSPYTPADFCSDVKKFGLFVRHKTLEEIAVHDIREWLSLLQTHEKMTAKTLSRKVSAIRNYFTWLVSENVLVANPALTIPHHKVFSPLPEVLFEEECRRLLASVSGNCRTYLLVLLLLETGMKIEELMELKVSCIDTSNQYAPEIWIKHTARKVKKDRKLKLPGEVIPVLRDYVSDYGVSDRLFPYTARFVRLLLTSAGEDAGVHKRVSAQMLRDTCAVRCIKAGEPIEAVLRKLGLSEKTWEDAREKYLKLTGRAL